MRPERGYESQRTNLIRQSKALPSKVRAVVVDRFESHALQSLQIWPPAARAIPYKAHICTRTRKYVLSEFWSSGGGAEVWEVWSTDGSAPLEQILVLELQRKALRVLPALLVKDRCRPVRVIVPNARAASVIQTYRLEAQHKVLVLELRILCGREQNDVYSRVCVECCSVGNMRTSFATLNCIE